LLTKNHASPGTLKNYERDGFKIIQSFFAEHNVDGYSDELIDSCIQHAREKHEAGARSLHQFQMLRKTAFLLRETHETRTLQWHHLPAWNTRLLAENPSSFLVNFLASIAAKLSSSTLRNKQNIVSQFLFFLEDNGTTDLSRLSHKDLLGYLEYISEHRPSGMGEVTPTIRSFLLYLKDRGITCNDFKALLNIKYNARRTIKPIFIGDEAERILRSIDRASAQGKRDYGMFTLARHYGMRSSDILNLKLRDINWKNAEISIIQRKTGCPVTYPLDTETGNAIADYILNARPESKLEYLFLQSYSPYGKIASSSSLCHLLKRYMSSAGVFHKPGDWKSTHTFRRTLGTRMLEAEVPLTTIMQVLGQRDPQSSKAYLSMSEKKLSECSLDLKGIEIAAGGWQ